LRPALWRGRRKEARLTSFLVFLLAAVLAIVVVVVVANVKRHERHRFEESSAQGRDHDDREHHH